MNFTATQGRLIVKVDQAETKSKGGILLSKPNNPDFYTGVILNVGSPRKDDNETFKVGERVAWQCYSGVEYKDGEDKILIINRTDIIAKVNE